ncbi:glycosyltransferase family 25 protein [Aurantimonas sp. VKM B-3413]|uniref:glycosyltransferase family 25 protein n=1 Tax=Aurantimonas sp. VKM B-3413 TaxID=2779401 RepID=UPI001E62ADB5|nr:glycosyltransferase family 25 protein [Aurantimonas sp. VKM B-3413]MCB8838628.1 glycosyltransferase family 25 protein [Aurantimonas sp. VKM B-3413]
MAPPAAATAASCVYINLDGAVARRTFMEEQAQRLDLALQRFAAVSASEVPDDVFAALSTQWERPLTRIEIAVFLSHKALWERAAATPGGLVVLEDDVVLSPRIASLLQEPPKDWDLVNLEYFDRRKFLRRAGGTATDAFTLTPVLRDKAGAGAYFISPRGAARLIADAAQAAPADAFLFKSRRLKIAQVEPAMAIQAHILAAHGIDPGIRTTTQIHQPREGLKVRPENLRYFARRIATQVDLLGHQAGRLGPTVFRRPRIDFGEFRRRP